MNARKSEAAGVRSASPARKPATIRRMHTRRSRRRGSAVVEMAVVTPLLMMMILGVMEFGWSMMVRETLVNATREACRVRVLQDATDADAQARFAAAVAPTGLTISPGMLSITSTNPGNGVVYTVTASVSREQISLTGVGEVLQRMIPGFLNGTVTVSSTMRQEIILN